MPRLCWLSFTTRGPGFLWHGIAMSFLGALTLLSLLGVRYLIRMLPLLIFEFVWKTIWEALCACGG